MSKIGDCEFEGTDRMRRRTTIPAAVHLELALAVPPILDAIPTPAQS